LESPRTGRALELRPCNQRGTTKRFAPHGRQRRRVAGMDRAEPRQRRRPSARGWGGNRGEKRRRTRPHRKRSCEAGLRCYVSARLSPSPSSSSPKTPKPPTPPATTIPSHHSFRSHTRERAPPAGRGGEADAPEAVAGRPQAPLLRRARLRGGPVSHRASFLVPRRCSSVPSSLKRACVRGIPESGPPSEQRGDWYGMRAREMDTGGLGFWRR